MVRKKKETIDEFMMRLIFNFENYNPNIRYTNKEIIYILIKIWKRIKEE